MGTNDAVEALESSLAQDSATPDFGASDRIAYLNEQRAKLRALVIEPVPVVAHAGPWAQEHCGLSAEPYHMLAVAYSPEGSGQCLLYNPVTRLFSLAYGHVTDQDGVDLVGYSSDDALAEWLG